MKPYIEHANITVPDIDASIKFLQCIHPDIRVRHDAVSDKGYRWAHVGTDDFYIALQRPNGNISKSLQDTYVDFGINHLAWVVADIEAVEQRLIQNKYRQGIPGEHSEYRKRIYYFDTSGFEWEIIQYFTDDPALKNEYS